MLYNKWNGVYIFETLILVWNYYFEVLKYGFCIKLMLSLGVESNE